MDIDTNIIILFIFLYIFMRNINKNFEVFLNILIIAIILAYVYYYNNKKEQLKLNLANNLEIEENIENINDDIYEHLNKLLKFKKYKQNIAMLLFTLIIFIKT